MKELELFSKITASATHELKNVFASIKECAGLMEDLLALGEKEGHTYNKRIKESLHAISDQVKKGDTVISCLNRFSHTVDSISNNVDLWDAISVMIALCQRMARQRQTTLTLEKKEIPISVSAFPFRVYMVIFMLIQALLEASLKGSLIKITASKSKDHIEVAGTLEKGNMDCIDKTEGFQSLSEVAGDLGLRITLDLKSSSLIVVFEGKE